MDKQVIFGTVPSKSNNYMVVHKGLIKTKALRAYEDSFYMQCNLYRNRNIEGRFEFYIDVFYPSDRSDLDNSLKICLDALQHIKAIKNDNKCTKIVAQKFIDKVNPRIEFSIVPVNLPE